MVFPGKHIKFRIFTILSSMCFVIGCITTVKDIDYIPASTITFRDSTGVVRISLFSGDNKVKTDPTAIYWWYDTKIIHRSQGGYSGRLLDGSYVRYGLNGELLEKGSFTEGLKSGTWLCWYQNGLIRSSYAFKDGVEEGDYSLNDEHGICLEQGTYKNGLIDGKYTRYNETGKPILQLLYMKGMIKDTLCADTTCFSK